MEWERGSQPGWMGIGKIALFIQCMNNKYCWSNGCVWILLCFCSAFYSVLAPLRYIDMQHFGENVSTSSRSTCLFVEWIENCTAREREKKRIAVLRIHEHFKFEAN